MALLPPDPGDIPQTVGPYRLDTLISWTSHALVYTCTLDGTKLVAKFTRRARHVEFHRAGDIMKTPDILRKMPIVDEAQFGNYDYMIMPRSVHRDLLEILLRFPSFPPRLDETLACKIMFQVVDHLFSLHEQNLCHLDLKPENIFLMSRESWPHDPDIVVGGFFWACPLSEGETSDTLLPPSAYAAPEVITGGDCLFLF
jgi:serine/threonine protein kinase